MSRTARERTVLASLLIVAASVFLVGVNWGLPSRAVDPFLFGDRTPWTGAEILQLAGDRAPGVQLGADVDRNPIDRTNAEPIVLNDTDQQRAEIVRRYRLFTYQPDEMITMMALAAMRPSMRDFDPKLYQYGGLWIYPVGGLIKLFAHPRADQTYYLDHPEAFGWFYIIARLYVVMWALVGAAAVFKIAQRLNNGDSLIAPIAATLCYAFLPVVVNMAHEAKPHLPAAVLVLLAMLAATKYVDTGGKRWWFVTAVLCGAAAGMVLSAVTSLVILVVMTILRRQDKPADRVVVLLASLLVAVDVYVTTNPYVLVHLLHDRAALMSNLANSQAMYNAPATWVGALGAVRHLVIGTTFPLLMFGMIAACGFARLTLLHRAKPTALTMLIAVVALVGLAPFAIFATAKPAEYARFALLPDILIAIVGVVGATNITQSKWMRLAVPALLVAYTFVHAISYDWHFGRDSIARTTRIIAAERLRGVGELSLAAEPAPYSLPPVDLFQTRLLLGAPPTIQTVDRVEPDAHGAEYWIRPRLFETPISWAAKPYRVAVRQERTR